MTLLQLLILLIVAGVCGSIGQAITGYSHGGCLVSVALGLIGALIGSWLADTFDLPNVLNLQFGDQTFPVVWSILGSILFVAVLNLILGGRRR